jgi:hypothetical protein
LLATCFGLSEKHHQAIKKKMKKDNLNTTHQNITFPDG